MSTHRDLARLALSLVEGTVRGEPAADELLAEGFTALDEAARAHAYLAGFLLTALAVDRPAFPYERIAEDLRWEILSSRAQALEQGRMPEQVVLEVATIDAPLVVSMRLNRDESAPVVVRRRLFRLDGQPVALCDSYYPAEWAEGTAITEMANISGGVDALIEDPAGPIRRSVARSVDDLVARMPIPDEVQRLDLPPGMPGVRVLRTTYDVDDAPLEVQDTVAAADRHTFRYEVSMR